MNVEQRNGVIALSSVPNQYGITSLMMHGALHYIYDWYTASGGDALLEEVVTPLMVFQLNRLLCKIGKLEYLDQMQLIYQDKV